MLGIFHGLGQFVPEDTIKEHEYYNLASAKGNEYADYNIACDHFEKKNFKLAIQYHEKAASNYCNMAMIELIKIYRSDEYGFKDVNRALHWAILSYLLNDETRQWLHTNILDGTIIWKPEYHHNWPLLNVTRIQEYSWLSKKITSVELSWSFKEQVLTLIWISKMRKTSLHSYIRQLPKCLTIVVIGYLSVSWISKE